MSKTVATVEPGRAHTKLIEYVEALDRRALFLITLAVSTVVILQYQFWNQPSVVDRANWDYFAQVIARGGVPYRDVVNIKSPFSAYIGALAIIVGEPLGLRDIFAIRIVFILLGALTVGFTFLVAHDYFKSRRIGLLAAAIMMAFNLFVDANVGGVQPKTPMIMFGLMSLWAVTKDRPFAAGLFGMLSALCWQPGLLFVGVAALAFSRYLTSWRDLKTVKVVAGASAPFAIYIVYFWAVGSLMDLYRWNIEYNLTVDAPRGLRTVSEFIDRITRLIKGPFHDERYYFVIGALGLAIALWQEARSAAKEGWGYLLDAAPRHAVMIAPVIYFAFCMINIQGGVDFVPLLPFISIFAALALVFALDKLTDVLLRLKPQLPRQIIQAGGYAIILGFVLVFSVADVFAYRVEFPTLKDQEAEVAEITSHLAAGDRIFVHGTAEILVLSGLTNADKHFFLDRGKDTYLDRVEPGGFAGWLERLKEKRPKVVAIERTKYVDRKDDFLDWVREDYRERKGQIFTYYVRKDADE
jgi:DolP-mannose mannosyltransferase